MRQDKACGQAALMCLFIAIGMIAMGGVLAAPFLPLLERMAEQTAMLAAATAMPEGTITVLREHFSGYIVDESEHSTLTEPEIPKPSDEDYQPPEQIVPPETHPPEVPYRPSGPPPEIEAKYRGELIEELMLGTESAVCQSIGAGYLRNYTQLDQSRIAAELAKPLKFAPLASGDVEVLIVHTHATEGYEYYDNTVYDIRNEWRTTDNGQNMVAVGNVIEQQLREAGIGVLHDTTQHDYPSYNGSYDRAAATIKKYLDEYPNIKLILDVHRDGIVRADNAIVKPTTVINGRKAAQLMLISGCDDGVLGLPNWADNMRMACAVTNAVESAYPTLTRPIFFSNGRYNMHLSGGLILLEVGSQGNTLDEALYTAELVGKALAEFILSAADSSK